MDELLKGNFSVKRPVSYDSSKEKLTLREALRVRALASLGGSMVYVERKKLNWDGENAK